PLPYTTLFRSEWHKHYPEEIPTSISYDEKPLHVFLQEGAKFYKEKKALHFMGKEISFTDLYFQARKMAGYMQSLGLRKGDRVAVMRHNCPHAVIYYCCSLFGGAFVVQHTPLYKGSEF